MALSTDCSNDYQKTRVIAYIDGFNLFYGIKNASRDADYLHRKHGGNLESCIGRSLYWLDIRAVIESQLRKSEMCVEIKYFSAPRKVPKLIEGIDPSPYLLSNQRQSRYFDALEASLGRKPILGWYSEKNPHTCTECGHRWPAMEEKVTDVNIAVHMITDAVNDKFDRALLMSADADLVPAVEAVRAQGKEVLLALPPGRKRAKHLRQCVDIANNVKLKAIRDCRLPDTIERPNLPPLVCPESWMPHDKWVWTINDPRTS